MPHHAKNFEAGPPHRDFVRWSRLVFNSHAIVGIVAKRYQLQSKIARSQRLLNLLVLVSSFGQGFHMISHALD